MSDPNPSGASPTQTAAPTPSAVASDSSPAAPAVSTPSSSGSEPRSPAPAGEAFDFSSIFEGGDDFAGAPTPAKAPAGVEAAAPVAPTSQPDTPVAPVTEAVPAPASVAPPVPPSQTPAPTEAPAPTAPQPQAAPAPLDPYDPGMLAQHLGQHEAAAMQFVADGLFKLSPQEAEELEQDVIGTVPKLLAKVFVKSQQNVLSQLGRMIPVMIQRHTEAMKRNSSNEDKFYSRWPDIKRETHHSNVVRYATVYRQMHPSATLEQMIEDLGPMIMMANKIVPSMGAPSPAAGQSPRQPAQGAGGRSPPPNPFVPAGAGPVSTAKAPELEPWEAMFNGGG